MKYSYCDICESEKRTTKYQLCMSCHAKYRISKKVYIPTEKEVRHLILETQLKGE